MPLLKKYAENGKLLETRDEPLNAENLHQYAEQYNADRVQGYIDCLEDMAKQFKSFLEIHGEKSWRYNTPHKVKGGTIKVYEEKEIFLEFAKAFVEKLPPNENSVEKPNLSG